MPKLLSSESVSPIELDEFLPPTSRWVRVGSGFIVLSLGGAIAASFFVQYKTTVKAPAIIRPSGESRLVQTIASGPVAEISVENNTPVKKGQPIARLDTTSQQAQKVELLANIEQGKQKFQQIENQLVAIEQQFIAESARIQRTTAAAVAEFQQSQRNNQTEGVTARAAVREAQARIDLIAQEVESYRQLVNSGAIARLQLVEKQSALTAAQAEMISLQARLNPSSGDVRAAEERIFQAQASGAASLANLRQLREQLIQQRIDIQQALEGTAQELAQVDLLLDNAVVRSPISGTLYELSLRNAGQVVSTGETIAQIVPESGPVVIKAMVPAQQINKVEVGMTAQMRVSACPFSEFGTVAGQVAAVSPDAVSQSGENRTVPNEPNAVNAFYSVLINPDTNHLKSGNTQEDCSLQPGTEGRATIISRKETVVTFLRRKTGLLIEKTQ